MLARDAEQRVRLEQLAKEVQDAKVEMTLYSEQLLKL